MQTLVVSHRESRRIHRRGGFMMLINMVAVLLIALIFAFMLNSGKTVKRKTEGQHIADAVGYSVGLQKARGLNAITATNHTSGEMLALIVVHHALGGDLLDELQCAEDDPQYGDDLNKLNSRLDSAKQAAKSAGARTPAYTTVRQKKGIKAEATLLSAKMVLKEYLVWIYETKVVAKAMQAYPPTKPAGVALERAMDVFEMEILAEYKVLNQFHREAIRLRGVKFEYRDRYLPDAKQFTQRVVDVMPSLLHETANELARKHGAARAFVVNPDLPAQLDPLSRAHSLPSVMIADRQEQGCCSCQSEATAVTRDQINKVSQLARSMAPWVYYHREPVWQALAKLAPLSRAGDAYKHYSDKYMKVLTDRYQTDRHDLGQFVLRDYPAPDKGWAAWTEDRTLADPLFGTLSVVYMESDSVIGSPTVFDQAHPGGQIFYAQSLTYNSNPQEPHPGRIDLRCKRITPNRQAVVGFDTLNWRPREHSGGKYEAPWELLAKTDEGGKPTPDFPGIRLNWQAKLAPASAEQLGQLKQASVPAAMRTPVDRIVDDVPGAMLSH